MMLMNLMRRPMVTMRLQMTSMGGYCHRTWCAKPGQELEYIHGRRIYKYGTISECRAKTGRPPLRLKWIDTNKGGRSLEEMRLRSRLVCTEVRRKGTEGHFAAAPPLESLRVLTSKLASEDPLSSGDPRKVSLVDVSRAHFYADS